MDDKLLYLFMCFLLLPKMDIIHEINNIIKSDFSPAFKTGYFIGLLILLIVFIMAIKKITRKTINPKKSIKLSNNSKTP